MLYLGRVDPKKGCETLCGTLLKDVTSGSAP